MRCIAAGARSADIEIVRVPGAWEIPSAARTLAETKQFDAIMTLGCLLRGETAHYEAIYNEVARGIGQSQQETGVPHAFGVLTCETLEQALDRAGVKAGNKGFEAAIAAIEMASIQTEDCCESEGELMGTRRKSRELAMQMLFQGDLGKQTPEEVRAAVLGRRATMWTTETRGFAEDLYRVATRARGRDRRADREALRRTGGWSGCRWWIATCCARRWRRCWVFRRRRRRSSSTRRWRLRGGMRRRSRSSS